jgi:hypothetical protein
MQKRKVKESTREDAGGGKRKTDALENRNNHLRKG